MPAESQAFGAEDFAAATNVSHETLGRLKTYADMLAEWNAVHNLVSRNSMSDLWRRHFLDSAQLAPLVPLKARSLIDLGSGAGFPGLVLAEVLRERAGFRAVLYESTAKKCSFLNAVAERLGLRVDIRNARAEAADREIFDVVTARALAGLPELLAYAQRFWGSETIALFPKGRNLGSELTEAHKSWTLKERQHPSMSDPDGVVLEVRELKRAERNNHR